MEIAESEVIAHDGGMKSDLCVSHPTFALHLDALRQSIDHQLAGLRDAQNGLGTTLGAIDQRLGAFVGLHEEHHAALMSSLSGMQGRLQDDMSRRASAMSTQLQVPQYGSMGTTPSGERQMNPEQHMGASCSLLSTGADGRSMRTYSTGADARLTPRTFSTNSLQSSPSLRAAFHRNVRHNLKLQSKESVASKFPSPPPGESLTSKFASSRIGEQKDSKGHLLTVTSASRLGAARPSQQSVASNYDDSTEVTACAQLSTISGSHEYEDEDELRTAVDSAITSGGRIGSKPSVRLSKQLTLADDQDVRSTLASKVEHLGHLRPAARYILMPGTLCCFALDVLIACAVVVTGIGVPIGLAYLDRRSLSRDQLGAVLCIVDVAWILGIVANFRTAFFHDGHMVTEVRAIALRYARSFLTLDLITAWPLVFAVGESDVVKVIQYAKLLRVLRLPPLFMRMKNFSASGALYPATIGVVAILMLNVLCSGWRSAQYDEPEAQWFDLYIKDIYFVMTVMSTVGFGDIHPDGTSERLYSILTMLIAPLIFGAVVSLISKVMEGHFNDKVTVQVAQARIFMKNRKVPQELQRQVLYNLRRNALQDSKMTLAPDLLGQLSPSVQRELLSELLRTTVLQFPLFKGANATFVGEVAQAHSWVHCGPGDVVLEEGQLMQEIVFVIRGKLMMMGHAEDPGVRLSQISTQSAEEDDVDVLTGAWFGEASLFASDHACQFSVVAVIESELAVLEAAHYHHIVGKYPRVLARHREILKGLKSRTLNLDMFAYHGASLEDDRNLTSKSHKFFQMLHNLRSPRTSIREESVVPTPDW